jgi:hypothetical protein
VEFTFTDARSLLQLGEGRGDGVPRVNWQGQERKIPVLRRHEMHQGLANAPSKYASERLGGQRSTASKIPPVARSCAPTATNVPLYTAA